MEKLERKINRAFTLSVISLLIVIAIVCLWMFKSREIAVVTLDTFVGVIVALLAIIVTIVLGWQIFNIFELKNKIDEVNELKKQFGQQQRTIEQLTLKNKHTTGYTWGKSCEKEENWFHAFRFLLISLEASLQLDNPINISMIFKHLRIVAKNIKSHTRCSKKRYQEVVLTDKSIRSLHNFTIIENEYLGLYNKIFAKIEVDDSEQ